jgi:hypothetical protein
MASDVLYVETLAAPLTVNTMPEGTWKAFADHGEVDTVLPDDGGDSDEVVGEFAKAGISVDELAGQLQHEGAKSFVSSWNELMARIASKRAALTQTVAGERRRTESSIRSWRRDALLVPCGRHVLVTNVDDDQRRQEQQDREHHSHHDRM